MNQWTPLVIPAKAGIHLDSRSPASTARSGWIPAFAGMTVLKFVAIRGRRLFDAGEVGRKPLAPSPHPLKSSRPRSLPQVQQLALAGFLVLAATSVAHADDERLAACNAAGHAIVLQPSAADAPAHARGIWLDRERLRWPGQGFRTDSHLTLYYSASGRMVATPGQPVDSADGALRLLPGRSKAADAEQFPHLTRGDPLQLPAIDPAQLRALHRGQLLLVREDPQGRVIEATGTQAAAALDDLYAAAEQQPLGVQIDNDATRFALWAPTARAVALCVYPTGSAAASHVQAAARDEDSGIWTSHADSDLSGHYYTWLVDVFVPGTGVVRNRTTDPYALSLTTDSTRVWIGDLDAAAVKPDGWDNSARPPPLQAQTDMVVYELHVRDFSINDASVPTPQRGNYAAFSASESAGMQHLAALANAGVTDIHLLPVFDIASIPEAGCITPQPEGAPDSEAQQALIGEIKDRDCFNWGYDPQHYTAPEGSYASDPADGAVRVREFRQMVQALHARGLRVGMDVVYNHTSHSGQHAKSVLDRIVPGYYHRLDADGAITTSTCCDNTATEHRMMARLMIDSAVVWARDYRIDSFRFDLMGHQPREAMLRLKHAVNAGAGREVQLVGEGWNFGEVVDGARFVQASQLSLPGTGIATFSDRARDAVRGGGCCDSGAALVSSQGWINGLHYAPNATATDMHSRDDLLRAADMVRVGLAGSLRDYALHTHDDRRVPLAQIDYAGQPAGYVAEPGEVVNYVENHDNPTLFDINVLRLPVDTPPTERARVQVLGLAVVAFSQGIAYFHAGGEILRSKSLDKNSYDSGDWFNRIDWTLSDNHFGIGLPPAWDNLDSWPQMRPLLANATSIRPSPADIAWTRDAFLDLLRIRASSTLFRMRSATDVKARLRMLNTGPEQIATLIAAHIDGRDYPGAGFSEIVYFINVDTEPHTLALAALAGRPWELHPVQRAPAAADSEPANDGSVDSATGKFRIPARSALVYVIDRAEEAD
jgi:pullulanase